jgi:acyl-coenzyme A thioesterase PaaI-like protein
MTFAVLPRRESNPVMPDDRVAGPQSFITGTAVSGFPGAALDAFGIRTVDAARGRVELEPSDYVENSLGAVQGGVVATMVERAAELALSHAASRPLAPVGLQLTYLALAREGPIRSAVEPLGVEERWGSARVELFDVGADRRTTVGRVVAARPGAGRR